MTAQEYEMIKFFSQINLVNLVCTLSRIKITGKPENIKHGQTHSYNNNDINNFRKRNEKKGQMKQQDLQQKGKKKKRCPPKKNLFLRVSSLTLLLAAFSAARAALFSTTARALFSARVACRACLAAIREPRTAACRDD